MSAPDLYAVFGYPVAHSRSPWIHTQFAALTHQSMVYQAREVPPGRFDAELDEFLTTGGKGLNITVPHKLAAFATAEILTPRAQRAGAVNTLAVQARCLLGDNTDGAGLVRDLRHNLGIELRHRRILLVGAGGAARGVLLPLLAEHPRALLIANRTAEKAVILAREFDDEGPIEGGGLEVELGPFDLVINATSASLAGEVPALPDGVVGPASVCYDMAYGTGPTAFMRWAAQRGAARVTDGLGMLVEQAAECFELWRGVRPPTSGLLAELRRQAAG